MKRTHPELYKRTWSTRFNCSVDSSATIARSWHSNDKTGLTHCSLVHFPLTRVRISGLAEQLHTSSGFIFRVSKLASNRKVSPNAAISKTIQKSHIFCIWHTSSTLSCNLRNGRRIKFLKYDWLSLYQYNQKEAYENPSDPLFYVIEIGFGFMSSWAHCKYPTMLHLAATGCLHPHCSG